MAIQCANQGEVEPDRKDGVDLTRESGNSVSSGARKMSAMPPRDISHAVSLKMRAAVRFAREAAEVL
jgi:hypothetical protein